MEHTCNFWVLTSIGWGGTGSEGGGKVEALIKLIGDMIQSKLRVLSILFTDTNTFVFLENIESSEIHLVISEGV